MAGENTSDPAQPGPLTEEVVEQKLEPIIRDLSPVKQDEIRQTFHSLMNVVNPQTGPRLDPETVRILTASVDKDNDNKFKYMIQRQTDAAADQARQHDLAMLQHRDGHKLLVPCVLSAIVVVVGLVAAGVGFIAYGREAVGSSMISGATGLFFGFLGGFGASKSLAKK